MKSKEFEHVPAPKIFECSLILKSSAELFRVVGETGKHTNKMVAWTMMMFSEPWYMVN